MKKMSFAILFFLLVPVLVNAEWVRGHMRDTDGDGIKDTYINGYNRTPADGNPYNNYSTQGNVNPYTGKEGTVKPHYDNRYDYNNYDSGNGNTYRRKY